MPDFDENYRRFVRASEKERRVKGPTICKPFNLHTPQSKSSQRRRTEIAGSDGNGEEWKGGAEGWRKGGASEGGQSKGAGWRGGGGESRSSSRSGRMSASMTGSLLLFRISKSGRWHFLLVQIGMLNSNL